MGEWGPGGPPGSTGVLGVAASYPYVVIDAAELIEWKRRSLGRHRRRLLRPEPSDQALQALARGDPRPICGGLCRAAAATGLSSHPALRTARTSYPLARVPRYPCGRRPSRDEKGAASGASRV